MKLLPALLLMLSFGAAAAESSWLTITGDPSRDDADTVEVDAGSIKVNGSIRTANLRVSRSTVRTSPWAGVKFRSFVALTEFDCNVRTARYLQTSFHADPRWRGTPVLSITYPPGTVATMRFLGITPNPAERIIKAACDLAAVTAN